MQANMSSTNGQWGWTDRTVQANSPAVWQNPSGGNCLTWGPRTTCVGDAAAPDQMFRLVGTIKRWHTHSFTVGHAHAECHSLGDAEPVVHAESHPDTGNVCIV